MTPSQLSVQLRHIAAKISNSKSPRRDLVAKDLKRILIALDESPVGSQFLVTFLDDTALVVNASSSEEAKQIGSSLYEAYLTDSLDDPEVAKSYAVENANVYSVPDPVGSMPGKWSGHIQVGSSAADVIKGDSQSNEAINNLVEKYIEEWGEDERASWDNKEEFDSYKKEEMLDYFMKDGDENTHYEWVTIRGTRPATKTDTFESFPWNRWQK